VQLRPLLLPRGHSPHRPYPETGGGFIAITHDRRNMGELMDITKEILRNLGLPPENGRLPIEGILSRFCAENAGPSRAALRAGADPGLRQQPGLSTP
jgi:hypothetical protein